MKLIKISVLLYSLFFVGYAYAESNESGFYLGVGFGSAKIDPLTNPAFALQGNFGYNFNNYFALELQANGMPSTQWQNNLLNSYNVFNIAAKGMLPLGDIFSIYGKLGAGMGYSNWSGDGLLEYDEETDDFYYDCHEGIYACTGRAQSPIVLGAIGISFKLTQDLSLFVENNNFIPLGGKEGRFGYTYNGVIGLQYTFHNSSPAASYQPSHNETYQQPLIDCTDEQYKDSCQILNQLSKPVDTISIDKFNQKRVIVLQDGSQYIIVLKGDTLVNVSIWYNIPIENLRVLNKLNNDKITVGQRLYLKKGR